MLFYDSLWAVCLLMCLSPFFEDAYAGYLCRVQKDKLLSEFKDALYSVSASIGAGRQLPRALEDAAESALLFLGDDSLIYPELLRITGNYKDRNSDIEGMLSDLAERSGLEEIKLFAKACGICIRSGGNMEEVCLKTSYMLIERIEFAKEAEAILSEKKLDTLLLILMPPGVLFFLNVCSYEYISVLYDTSRGRLLMSGALALMAAAVLWSLRIMKLKI